MEYLIFAAVTLVTVALEFLYCSYIGVFETGLKIPVSSKYKNDTVVPFNGIKLILTIIICAVLSFCVQISLKSNNVSVINFIKLYGLFVMVLGASIIDLKKKIIPNMIILVGLAFRLLIYIYEIIKSENLKETITSDLIGFAIGFGILAVVSFITKQGIGFGDAKLFGVIGLVGGSFCTYSTLFASLIISALVSVILLVTGKKGKKDTIPFGPCIAIGYTLVIFLTSY